MVTALALFSGGLDSVLACRVLMAQNIKVIAVKFITPFFGAELLSDPEARQSYRQKIWCRYEIKVILQDLSAPFGKTP